MTMRQLETTMIVFARSHFKEPRLKLKDLMEWSSRELKPEAADEQSAFLPQVGVWVTVKMPPPKKARGKAGVV